MSRRTWLAMRCKPSPRPTPVKSGYKSKPLPRKGGKGKPGKPKWSGTEDDDAEEPKPAGSKTPLIVVGAVALVALIAAGVYFLRGKSGDEPSAKEPAKAEPAPAQPETPQTTEPRDQAPPGTGLPKAPAPARTQRPPAVRPAGFPRLPKRSDSRPRRSAPTAR